MMSNVARNVNFLIKDSPCNCSFIGPLCSKVLNNVKLSLSGYLNIVTEGIKLFISLIIKVIK